MMDKIDKVIEENKNLAQNPKFVEENWNLFYSYAKKRKIIFYGISEISTILWLRFENIFSIVAAIDNDVKKQGHFLSEFFDESDLEKSKNVKIESKDILKKYNPDEVVILISSLRAYEEIGIELDKQNFYCHFSILILEYNYRKNKEIKNLSFPKIDEYKSKYSKKCIENYSIQNNKIVFFDMGVYLDHGKYITEQLLNINQNIEIVWIGSDIKNVRKNIKVLPKDNWKQCLYEIATSKIFVFNCLPLPTGLLKRNNQIFIQIKHWGSITLKTFYISDVENQIKKFIDFFSTKQLQYNKYIYKLNGEWTDYIITGSEFDEESCREGFNFNGSFIRCGSPRSDILFNPQKCKNKVYNKLNLSKEENIVLYVPTYRRYNFSNSENRLNFDLLLKVLNQKWSGKWKILIRLHPFDRKFSKQIEQNEDIMDVSNYDDGQEILAISDIIISDFSSIMFEFSYIFKPVFLYASDKEKYIKNDRNFLINYEELPFPISTTNEELSKQILNFDENEYKQKVQAFLDKYGVHEDGHASERAAKFILKLLSGEGEAYA